MTTALAGYYILYPRGAGAADGPMPHGYVMVSRWVNAAEAKLWMMNGGTYVPPQVGGGGRVYVTLFGAPRPPLTDPIRIDFGIPQAALQTAGRSDWRQLVQSIANVPIYNLTIQVANSIPASRITGKRSLQPGAPSSVPIRSRCRLPSPDPDRLFVLHGVKTEPRSAIAPLNSTQLNSCLSCATRVPRVSGGISMARKVGQIVRFGPHLARACIQGP